MRIELSDSVKPWRRSMAITGQEFKILELGAMGYTDSSISFELGIAKDTIAGNWRRILVKMGASNRAEALDKFSKRIHEGTTSSHSIPEAFLSDLADREEAQKKLLEAITSASMCYINGRQNVRQVYSRMLDDLLALTGSTYGLIGIVHYESGIPYLGEHALTCTDWDDVTQARYEASHKDHLLFRNIDGAFGECIKTREVVIANSPRSSAVPTGHPPITTFIGIPVFSGVDLVGIIGLANRPEGYAKNVAEFLKPIVSTCANITVAWKLETQRRQMERDLNVSNCMVRTLVDRTPSAVLYESADRRLEFINPRFGQLFGIEAAPDQVVGIDAALIIKHSKRLFMDPERFHTRVEDLIAVQESFYGELIELADGGVFRRDFVVVRSGPAVCGYFWHYRELTSPFDE